MWLEIGWGNRSQDRILTWTLQHISNASGIWSSGYFLGGSRHPAKQPPQNTATTICHNMPYAGTCHNASLVTSLCHRDTCHSLSQSSWSGA